MEEIREQPSPSPANVSIETNEEGAVSGTGSLDIEARQAESTPEQYDIGKFKSVEALLDAYTSLQAEFTKKCQRLSDLEKEKTALETKPTTDEKLAQFLSKNQEALPYAPELKTILSEGEGSADSAWAKLVLSRLAQGDTHDPIVNRYVLSSDELKHKIVENYLSALSAQKPPLVISSQKGERVSSTAPDTPSSLTDAKRLVEKMFS